MNETQTRIKQNIETIFGSSFNFDKIKPASPNALTWNGLTPQELEKFVAKGLNLLTEVRNNISELDDLSPLDVKNLDSSITEFINQYSINGLPSISVDQITNQHHSCLNYLNSIISIINTSDFGARVLYRNYLTQKVSSLTEAENISNKLHLKEVSINDAIQSAEKWLKTKQDVGGKTIEEQAEAFYDMALNHIGLIGWSRLKKQPETFKEKFFRFIFDYDFAGKWVWLVSTLLFAGITGVVTYEFIIKSASLNADIKVGSAILKIAGLIVPAYLTLFSSNQYLYHKRLYDNYMFKFSSMKTMNNLMSIHKQQGSEKILEKGLDILFTEPKVKDGNSKYDTQLVNELVKMLRDQISK